MYFILFFLSLLFQNISDKKLVYFQTKMSICLFIFLKWKVLHKPVRAAFHGNLVWNRLIVMSAYFFMSPSVLDFMSPLARPHLQYFSIFIYSFHEFPVTLQNHSNNSDINVFKGQGEYHALRKVLKIWKL